MKLKFKNSNGFEVIKVKLNQIDRMKLHQIKFQLNRLGTNSPNRDQNADAKGEV